MRSLARDILGWAVTVLLALSVALASRPHEAPSRVELLLTALGLADGTWSAGLCAAGRGDDGPPVHVERCSLCVLGKVAVLGHVPTLADRVLGWAPTATSSPPSRVLATSWPPAPPARGPPPASVA